MLDSKAAKAALGAEAEAVGAWSQLCRIAATLKEEDERERDGRRSWDDMVTVKARHPDLVATLVSTNAAGVRR
jgi:hypothetical protein